MLETKQIKLKKILPFNAKYIEEEFKKQNLDVLRWAVVDITDTEFILDAAVCLEEL